MVKRQTVLMKRSIWLFSFLFSLLSGFLCAQGGSNPFDIQSRTSTPTATVEVDSPAEDTVSKAVSNNPFDLVSESSAIVPVQKPKPAITPPKKTPEPEVAPKPELRNTAPVSTSKGFLFSLILSIMITLTLLITLLRGILAKGFRAFFNDNILSQLHREHGPVGNMPYLLFYFFFFFNLTAFVWLANSHFQWAKLDGNWKTVGMIALGVLFVFFVKHFLLKVIEIVFPVEKEVRLYNFTIIVFSMILGMFLVPLNTLLAYGPQEMAKPVFYGAVSLIGLIYLYRAFRGILIGARFLSLHKFHFLLYICAIEIAPLVVLWKWATSQTGS